MPPAKQAAPVEEPVTFVNHTQQLMTVRGGSSQVVPFYGCCGAFVIYASIGLGASFYRSNYPTTIPSEMEKMIKGGLEKFKTGLHVLLDKHKTSKGLAVMILTEAEKGDYQSVLDELNFKLSAGPFKNPNTNHNLYLYTIDMSTYQPAEPLKKSAIKKG